MINSGPVRLLLATAVCLAGLNISPLSTAAADDFTFVYLGREADTEYEPVKAYTGLVLRERRRPVEGARLAIRESKIMGRSLGLTFELREEILVGGADATAAIREIAETATASVFLLDLPLDELSAAVRELKDAPLLMFNVRHGNDVLRGEDCSPVLFHTIPSDAMLMDGLAQFLKQKAWDEVLVLQGETADDARLAAAFQAAATKFRLDIVDMRPFKLGNDPRDRGQNNIRLMTSRSNYDVVFLADTLGEFGRYVPYQTFHPRPVVGSEGLSASAWHWTWERHGAPQLNQRFEKLADYRMSDTGWATWAAIRAVVEAVVRGGKIDVAAIRAFLTSEGINLDTYKGAPGSFRSWDNQLRQPILLHTYDAVIARAPIEGFLHQFNNLDTLGVDQRESSCRF